MQMPTGDDPHAGRKQPGQAQDASLDGAASLSSTRLIDHRPRRCDDAQVLALVQDLPGSGSPRCHVFTAGLLNEAGDLYREVDLHGEYQALLFTAGMNGNGFWRLQPGEPFFVEGYDSVFTKR